ncbi:MAG: Mur ligase family protein [Propionibacteriaceae bacterium]|nr:Mur ligase family protein [Propionibacteriaceae bacterium]
MDFDHVLRLMFLFAGKRQKRRSSVAAMTRALQLLGNPHSNLRTIHVTGTSGKTSTCYYLRALLEASGRRTGLTISPHIHTLSERVQIGGAPLDQERFCNYANQMLDLLEPMRGELTYFELMICLALWAFHKEKVDYAIVEVGIGGTRDATNVLSHDQKVAVIGPIGLDHTEKLGSTLEEIAAQKAGIIPKDGTVFVADQSPEVLEVIRDRARVFGALVGVVPQPTSPDNQLPKFQQHNWAMARTVAAYLAKRDGFDLPKASQVEALKNNTPPARFEWLECHNHRILLDGAHSPPKMASLVETLRTQGEGPFPTLATLSRAPDEKIVETLATLKPVVSHLIICDFVLGQDNKVKTSVPCHQIARVARSLAIECTVIPNLENAVDTLLSYPDHKLLVTGSLYLAALVRPLLCSAPGTTI